MKKKAVPSVSDTQKKANTEELTEWLADSNQTEPDNERTPPIPPTKDEDIEFIFYRHLERLFRRN